MSDKTNSIDSAAIGVEVSWSFGHGDAEAVTLPRRAVRNLLANRNFNSALVPEMSSDMALRKAQHAVKGRSKRIVIQELRRPNKDTPRAFGVYKVLGKDGESGDDVVMGARSRVQGEAVVCLPPEGDSDFVDVDCERIGNEITRIANSLIQNVINRDISDMLVAIGWGIGVDWISRRRNSGGVYFIPSSETAENFVGLLQDLEQLSHEHALETGRHKAGFTGRSYHFIPQVMEVYPKPLTMNMWKGSAQDQYEAQTDQLIKDLDKMNQDDKMRDSTIQARAEECDRLMAKAEKHRLFLAGAVESITGRLTDIRNQFTKRLDENAKDAAGALAAVDEALAAPPKSKRRVKRTKKVKAEPKAPALDPETASVDDLFNV